MMILISVVSCGGGLSGPNVFINGQVSGAVEGDNVVVILYNNENKMKNSKTIKTSTTSANNWKFNTSVTAGTYYVCAFVDTNNDKDFSMGEKYGCNAIPAEITKESTNAERNVTINK